MSVSVFKKLIGTWQNTKTNTIMTLTTDKKVKIIVSPEICVLACVSRNMFLRQAPSGRSINGQRKAPLTL